MYPIGQSFYAYYNPQDPSEAVVEPGYANMVLLILALIWLLISTIGLWRYISMRAELPDSSKGDPESGIRFVSA
jgi:hypothetical protein